jgi:hypothetical protein
MRLMDHSLPVVLPSYGPSWCAYDAVSSGHVSSYI